MTYNQKLLLVAGASALALCACEKKESAISDTSTAMIMDSAHAFDSSMLRNDSLMRADSIRLDSARRADSIRIVDTLVSGLGSKQ